MEETISSDHDIWNFEYVFWKLKIIPNGNFETGIEDEMGNPIQKSSK